jgi:PAS domain S-box-containing protein
MILVVNDDAECVGVLTSILASAGFGVHPAANGGLELEHRPSRPGMEWSETDGRMEDLANRAPVAIWVMDGDQRLLFHNKRAAAFVGIAISRVLNDRWAAIVHPQDLEGARAKYTAAVAARRGFRIECRMRRGNGRYHWALHTGVPRFVRGEFAGHIGTSVDISDFKRSQERMITAQKLESLGALTAGIAHDFNTLVGSIFAASDLALFDLPPDSPVRENIGRIYTAATRASEIVNLLMAYAGAGSARLERVNLSRVVAEMVDVLRDTIPPNVELDVSLSRDLPEVFAAAAQMRQVLSNLVINAAESLGRQNGVVRVVTERVSRARQGEYCRLVVSDTGCGMAADVCGRVFDPFFTTKFLGRGLGLAVVQGIVRSLGGAINVFSAPGAGSTFEVLMPCANAQMEKPRFMAQAASGSVQSADRT